MRVLAHLEDLNLAALQFDILHRHLLLLHDLDGDGLEGLFVHGRLNKTELALAEGLLDLIEVEDI